MEPIDGIWRSNFIARCLARSVSGGHRFCDELAGSGCALRGSGVADFLGGRWGWFTAGWPLNFAGNSLSDWIKIFRAAQVLCPH